MFLKTIKLTNFRNYSAQQLEFEKPVTLLIGNNAQGKSNFLEAIYFLATTKSLRADQEGEIIRSGEGFVRVEGKLERGGEEINLQIGLQLNEGQIRKKVALNNIPRRVLDYTGQLVAVLFSPQDINLVNGSPSLRRAHIDHVLLQVDRPYKKAVADYEEVVTKKNKILKRIKEGVGRLDELTYWAQQQVLSGQIISEKRRSFFRFLNGLEKKFGNFRFDYLENILTADRLKEYQSRELAAAASLIGPHRDDFQFLLAGQDLAKFGSRGEQRTAVLQLKLSELEFMEQAIGERPILLLDDIFSELDLKHREYVVEAAGFQQTIITTIEPEEVPQSLSLQADIFQVEGGKIIQ